MILIGQYDSPFVRRVAIALTLYEIAFEHRPWSVFRDADKLAAFNPLRRVPTLVLDDGEALIESGAILDALDQMVGEARALTPARGAGRRQALKVCALASGLADKAVSLVYERLLHETVSPVWINRCRSQMAGVLDALEADRDERTGPWWLGQTISHADIMAACALRFAREAHLDVVDLSRWPSLEAHSAACEALPVFQAIQQPFTAAPPAA